MHHELYLADVTATKDRMGAPTPEPRNAAEYLRRFNANEKIDGFGIGNVHIHMPCPFCAAPEFMVFEVLQTEQAMMKGATCKECGRGARAQIRKDAAGTSFEILQTAGPDQPEWLTPKMRRIQT